MYKPLADSTLNNMTKKEIIELLRTAEHNAKVSQEWVAQQAENLKDWKPVVHGRWEQVKKWETKAKYRCSVCGREIMSAVKVNIEKYPYCHCGAKMDGGIVNGR